MPVFYTKSCGLTEFRGRSRVMTTQMRLLYICVAGPPCGRPPLPRQMATEHSLCHIVVVSYGAVVPINLTSWGYLWWCLHRYPVSVIFGGLYYMSLNVHIIAGMFLLL